MRGQRTGKGRLDFADGSFYEGDFVDGQQHGYGVYHYASEDRTYEGNFAENLYEGKGKMTYKNGNIYQGDFH